MKKISWQGIAAAILLVIGLLQLAAFLLILARFKLVKPQSLILGILFVGSAIALHNAARSEK